MLTVAVSSLGPSGGHRGPTPLEPALLQLPNPYCHLGYEDKQAWLRPPKVSVDTPSDPAIRVLGGVHYRRNLTARGRRVQSLGAALVCAVDRESAPVSTTAYTQQSSQAKGCSAATRESDAALHTTDTTQMHHKESKDRSQTLVWMFMWERRVESPQAHGASAFVSLPLPGGLGGWELEVGDGAIPTVCL